MIDLTELGRGKVMKRRHNAASRQCSLYMSGNTPPWRNERLELFVDAYKSIRHRYEDLSGKVLLVLLRGTCRRIPRCGEHDHVTTRSGRIVAERKQICEVRPACDQLITRLHRPILRPRTDDNRIPDARQPRREAASGRSSTTEDSYLHANSVTHRRR